MNLPRNFIEVRCPVCRHTFYSRQTTQVECYYCKSIVELEKNNEIVNFEPPEYHRSAIWILSIISIILIVTIVIDALLSKNTQDKLVIVGLAIGLLPILYFWLPIQMGYDRKYLRFGVMISFTLMLFLVMILNLGNFISL